MDRYWRVSACVLLAGGVIAAGILNAQDTPLLETPTAEVTLVDLPVIEPSVTPPPTLTETPYPTNTTAPTLTETPSITPSLTPTITPSIMLSATASPVGTASATPAPQIVTATEDRWILATVAPIQDSAARMALLTSADWCHRWNFLAESGAPPITGVMGDGNISTWESGRGWYGETPEDVPGLGANLDRNFIKLVFPSATAVTEVSFGWTPVTSFAGNPGWWLGRNGGYGGYTYILSGQTAVSALVDDTVTQLLVGFERGGPYVSPVADITHLRVTGTGTAPTFTTGEGCDPDLPITSTPTPSATPTATEITCPSGSQLRAAQSFGQNGVPQPQQDGDQCAPGAPTPHIMQAVLYNDLPTRTVLYTFQENYPEYLSVTPTLVFIPILDPTAVVLEYQTFPPALPTGAIQEIWYITPQPVVFDLVDNKIKLYTFDTYSLEARPYCCLSNGTALNGDGMHVNLQIVTPGPSLTPTPTAVPEQFKIRIYDTTSQAWSATEVAAINLGVTKVGQAFDYLSNASNTPQSAFNQAMMETSQTEILFLRLNQSGAISVPNYTYNAGGSPITLQYAAVPVGYCKTYQEGTVNNVRMPAAVICNGGLLDHYSGTTLTLQADEYTIVHELGHLFDYHTQYGLSAPIDGSFQLFDCSTPKVFLMGASTQWTRGRHGWGTGPAEYMKGSTVVPLITNFQQDSATDTKETAADSFLNWVYRLTATQGALAIDPCTSTPTSWSGPGFLNQSWSATPHPAIVQDSAGIVPGTPEPGLPGDARHFDVDARIRAIFSSHQW